MSKIKMLLDVVQDLRSLTDSIEALTRAIEELEGAQADVVKPEATAVVPAQITEAQAAESSRSPLEPFLPRPSRRRWWNCAPS